MLKTLPPRFAQLRVRDLMLIEHLDELGSLTEAAALMNVTQSAITQALQSVEHAFGVPLIERGRRGQRGLRLTAAGTAALMHLRVGRRELELAFAAATEPARPVLRIGALPLTLEQILPRALEHLRQRIPLVQVHLNEDTVPSLWRRIEAGEFDAIVSRLPVLGEHQRMPEGVTHRAIGVESMVLVCGRKHPISGLPKPELADLLAHDWVLPLEGSYTRLAIEQLFLRAGLKGPRVAISSANFHANLRLAATGSLLALAPRSATLAVQAMLDLVILPIDWGQQSTDLALVWRQANLCNPALSTFLECF